MSAQMIQEKSHLVCAAVGLLTSTAMVMEPLTVKVSERFPFWMSTTMTWNVSSADQCPNDNTKATLGVCGCGTSDADIDKDGTPDCFGNCWW